MKLESAIQEAEKDVAKLRLELVRLAKRLNTATLDGCAALEGGVRHGAFGPYWAVDKFDAVCDIAPTIDVLRQLLDERQRALNVLRSVATTQEEEGDD